MGTVSEDQAKTVVRNRIGEWRTTRGMTLEDLAEQTNMSTSYLSRLITGKRTLSLKHMEKIAAALDVPVSYLLPKDLSLLTIEELELAKQVVLNEAEFSIEQIGAFNSSLDENVLADKNLIAGLSPEPNATKGELVKFGRELVPIFGQAAGGPDGRFIMNGERIDSVLRPPSLANVKDGYGVFIHGTSMLPRYEPGEIVFAAPHRPYRAGNYVVIQVKTPGEEVPSGYVKKLVSFNNREIVLEQLNPPEDEDRIMLFASAMVLSVHKIVGTSTD